MYHSLHLCWIAILILITLGYLHYQELFKNKKKNKKNSTSITEDKNDFFEEQTLSDIYVEKNKIDYQDYLLRQKETIGNSNFKLGYSELDNTNPATLGFCPLGYYFNTQKGEFTGNTDDVFTKCQKCFDCHQQQGYYVSGGCMGDQNTQCKAGKIPYEIFLAAHAGRNPLHKQLPRFHIHKIVSGAPSSDSHLHV